MRKIYYIIEFLFLELLDTHISSHHLIREGERITPLPLSLENPSRVKLSLENRSREKLSLEKPGRGRRGGKYNYIKKYI